MIFDLSIIIPFYNANKFINKSLKDSLKISKRNSNIQIIYINNNSIDSSNTILKSKIKNLKNIKLFNTNKKKGIGPGVARNLGIKKADSNLIMFLDVDDCIEIKYLKDLIQYCKKFNNNFIFLNVKSKKKISPNVRYNQDNLQLFFKNSNNMWCIGKIFKKDFLIKNKLFFLKNIYEDIFFIFKCHYYNNEKINYYPKKIYIKKEDSDSITNSQITLNHLKSKFNAFKSIELFLKKKKLKIFKNLYKDIKYRFRGEFYNEYQNIINSNLKKDVKEVFVSYIKQLYKNSINKKFKLISKKDKITKKILFNV